MKTNMRDGLGQETGGSLGTSPAGERWVCEASSNSHAGGARARHPAVSSRSPWALVKHVLCASKVLKLNLQYFGTAISILFYYCDPLVGPCRE